MRDGFEVFVDSGLGAEMDRAGDEDVGGVVHSFPEEVRNHDVADAMGFAFDDDVGFVVELFEALI